MSTIGGIWYSFWFKEVVSDPDDEYDQILIKSVKIGDKEETTVPIDDYYKLFDLSDENNGIAKYMSDNHGEIFKILSGTHEKYKIAAVEVKVQGSIELTFFENNTLHPDKVEFKRSMFPHFRFSKHATKIYDIKAKMDGERIATFIEEPHGKYRTGWDNCGRPYGYVERTFL